MPNWIEASHYILHEGDPFGDFLGNHGIDAFDFLVVLKLVAVDVEELSDGAILLELLLIPGD